ncbi:hypothetical protein [Xanthomonas phage RTH11]|nr:hypothetical protein [Xanthomonas phage RTH11]
MAKNTTAPSATPNAKVVKKALRKSAVCTISTVEDQVWKVEGIRIVIRLPEYVGAAASDGLGYDYLRALPHNDVLAALSLRLNKVFGHPVSFVAVRGDGTIVEARAGEGRLSTLLSSFRDSYKQTARAKKAAAK